MRNKKFLIVMILFHLFLFTNCSSQNKDSSDNEESQRVLENRQPAVAGRFYEADPEVLKENLRELFTKAKLKKNKNVIAIIAPHAGYVYSGEVAASSFNQIDKNKKYDNIFLIGSSHTASFDGASIYSKGNYITPLDEVKVNIPLAEKLIEKHGFFTFNKQAHLQEHSLEVELPFLQYALKEDFQIVPIIIGSQTPEISEKVAKALQPYFNLNNLFIISTDFSHYPDYQNATIADKAIADAILTNSPFNLINAINDNASKNIPNLATSICGWTSALTLLYMSENYKNMKITPIQYMNSGDAQYGDKNKVVGYYAIAFSMQNSDVQVESEFILSKNDKKDLLEIARNTLETYIRKNKVPDLDPSDFSENIKKHCGAFVTLNKDHKLRGCIGRFIADEPLYEIVQQMAIASCTQDKRFPAVNVNELDKIEIEISVLSPLKKINSIDEIELGKHGIYLKKGYASGTFLPQVATETGWTKEEFLGHCARDKAKIGWKGWKNAEIYIFEANVFTEAEF